MIEKIIKVYISSFMFFSLCCADATGAYDRFVESTTYSYSSTESAITANIELQNGENWHYRCHSSREDLLAQLEEDFYEGNKVIIDFVPHQSYYSISVKSPRGWHMYDVRPSKDTLLSIFPRVAGLEKYTVKKAGLFSEGKRQYTLSLDDGSRWLFETPDYDLFDDFYFRPNDRIIITKSHDQKLSLINYDGSYLNCEDINRRHIFEDRKKQNVTLIE